MNALGALPKDVRVVLLFNTCADASRAARLHTADCPMTNTSGRRVIRTEGAELPAQIADLRERGFSVRECKCIERARQAMT